MYQALVSTLYILFTLYVHFISTLVFSLTMTHPLSLSPLSSLLRFLLAPADVVSLANRRVGLLWFGCKPRLTSLMASSPDVPLIT